MSYLVLDDNVVFFIIFMLEALPSPIIFLAASLRLALYHTFGQVQRSRPAEPVKNLRQRDQQTDFIRGARPRGGYESESGTFAVEMER